MINYLDEGIDSETFVELDPSLIYAMGIKMADCIRLHKTIPEVKVISRILFFFSECH